MIIINNRNPFPNQYIITYRDMIKCGYMTISNGKKITWYKMLSRFTPDGIVPKEFKFPSFNHVLLQREDTKMYQVIF